MSDKQKLTLLAKAVGVTLVAGLTTMPMAYADSNPFSMTDLGTGYKVASSEEGKCGGKKHKEGECGEGKCGAEKSDKEGKCGAEKSDKEGKCGEGKCGGSMSDKEEKDGTKKTDKEGKCGSQS